MLYAFGLPVEVTTDKQCTRSGSDHIKLKHEARADRMRLKFNLDDSFVLCSHCGKALSLK